MQGLYRSMARHGRNGLGLFAFVAFLSGCSDMLSEPEADVSLQGHQVGAGSGAVCSPVDTADTTCDRRDDDCDGKRDEDCDFNPSNCPHGYRKVVGTFGDDVLTGSSHKDCIVGYGGDDTIRGLGNDDLLVGGPGNDTIEGGSGDDEIKGGTGADEIDGGAGRDEIKGGDGNDRIDAGSGNDEVEGGRCHDTIHGGLGLDDLDGNGGSDRIFSARIFNRVDGGAGVDACSGSHCELSPHSAACLSDANCSGGKRCVVATGICVAAGDAAVTDATCDGVDDDCDNQNDEDFVGMPRTCGVGACQRTGGVACVDGTLQDSCVPGTPAANDASCNGIDDDCDGRTDENFVSAPTMCGVGACASTGMTSCVGGMVQDSCHAGAPAANDASCNGSDDDCNGQVDEDFMPSCVGPSSMTCVGGMVVTVDCDDANFCNGEETCSAGACSPGTPPVVDDGDPCTTDSCDPLTGEVSHEPVPVGTSCSDDAVCNGEETCQLSCVGVSSDTVAWWRGEGNGADSHDSLHGTLQGGVGFAAGEVDQAFVMDGVDDAVNLNAHAAALHNIGGQATLEFWMKSTFDVCRTVFNLRQGRFADQTLQIGNGCSTALTDEIVTWSYINGATTSTVGYQSVNRSVLLDDNWHHVALTLDGTNTRIYVDGAAVVATIGVGADHGDWGGFALPPTIAAIGASLASVTVPTWFFGSLDEVTLYDRALSAAEIAAIYFAGSAGKCTGTEGGGLVCTPGLPEPAGTPCEDGGMCDGDGMCEP